MFKWEKLGQLVDISQINHVDYMDEYAQAPSVLKFDDFIRVYFSCRLKPDVNGMYISRESYLDLNRKNLFEILRVSDKPVIELGGIGEFDEYGTYPMGVEPYNGLFYGYYGGWTRGEAVPFDVAVGLAISHDQGKTFKKVGKGPVLSSTPDEPFIIASPKIRRFNNLWYLFYAAGKKWITADDGKVEPIYKIRLAVSEDGVNWTKIHKDLIEVQHEYDEAQATGDVIFRNGIYHMFYSYRQSTDYRRNKDRSYRIGYASSIDLINWRREDSKVGIDVSPEGWDSEMVAYPHVFELDGEIYMFYLGNQVGKYGFGVAKLVGDLI